MVKCNDKWRQLKETLKSATLLHWLQWLQERAIFGSFSSWTENIYRSRVSGHQRRNICQVAGFNNILILLSKTLNRYQLNSIHRINGRAISVWSSLSLNICKCCNEVSLELHGGEFFLKKKCYTQCQGKAMQCRKVAVLPEMQQKVCETMQCHMRASADHFFPWLIYFWWS